MDPVEAFRREVALGDDAALDRLALLIGAVGDGPLDVDEQLARLDALARDFGGGTASDLMGWLHIRGFRGNAEAYYDPENSFLHRVLDRRLGIPITLSVLAIEVGRRCGVELVGIGLPGEFVVAERRDPERFHNPYRARSMDAAEVAELVRRFVGPEAVLTPAMRRPVPPLAVAGRMLTNLAHIYAHTERVAELVWALELQVMLPGTRPSVRRQLAAALTRQGRFWEAAVVVEELVADPPAESGPDEREADEAFLRQLRGHFN